MKNEFTKAATSRWHVVTENAFTSGSAERAAPELARQIEDRIAQENMNAQAAVVQIHAQQGIVVVECDDDFGTRLNDLPGASYAEKAKPAAKGPKMR